MGLFKSKQERRIERDIEIRKGIAKVKKQIGDLGKYEKEWLTKAQQAKQIGDKQGLAFLKRTLKNTVAQRRMLERQLLMMESAFQLKNQMETYQQFATSMTAMSRAIAEAFKSTDLMKTQKEFETAITKAESMEQMMDIFLNMSTGSMMAMEPTEEAVTDSEIDSLVDEAIKTEAPGLDPEVEKNLRQVEEELKGKG